MSFLQLTDEDRLALIKVQTLCETEAELRRAHRGDAVGLGQMQKAEQLDAEANALLDAAETLGWLREPARTPAMASQLPAVRSSLAHGSTSPAAKQPGLFKPL